MDLHLILYIHTQYTVYMYMHVLWTSNHCSASISTSPNTSLVPGPAHPSCPVPEIETEWIHNYTNVDFALEAAHRLSRKSPRKTPASGSSEQQARSVQHYCSFEIWAFKILVAKQLPTSTCTYTLSLVCIYMYMYSVCIYMNNQVHRALFS